MVERYIQNYNNKRSHRAIENDTSFDKLKGRVKDLSAKGQKA